MSTGVLMYCFDTPDTNYHKLAERCVAQVKKHLQLEITIVTDIDTYKRFKPMGMINYKLVKAQTTNTRSYRGKKSPGIITVSYTHLTLPTIYSV